MLRGHLRSVCEQNPIFAEKRLRSYFHNRVGADFVGFFRDTGAFAADKFRGADITSERGLENIFESFTKIIKIYLKILGKKM